MRILLLCCQMTERPAVLICQVKMLPLILYSEVWYYYNYFITVVDLD